MPFVTIRYGPYLAYGTIDHRVQKITGLFSILDHMGYEIEVIQINEYNRLTIEMYDREIFRCDIRNLMFNMTAEDDPVCQRAVRAVEEAKCRMCVDENIPMHRSSSKGRRELANNELTNQSSLQDSLPSNADLLYEIHAPNMAQKPQSVQAIKVASIIESNSRQQMMEEKIGKVTIMEDKNTFSNDRHREEEDLSSSDDEASKSDD